MVWEETLAEAERTGNLNLFARSLAGFTDSFLASHSLRHRFGPVHFYALIGGVTAITSWVTDAGLTVTCCA